MTKQELSAEQQALLNKLAPLIQEYLNETKLPTSLAAYLKELAFMQIVIDGKLIGFWGGRFRRSGGMKLMTIKAFYVKPEFRGRYLNRAADDLVAMLERQGVTDLEVWNAPEVQKWFEKRYKMKPQIYVTFNPLRDYRIPRVKNASGIE
jgi:hypothetical protein